MTQTQSPTPFSFKVKLEYDGNGNVVEREVENKDKDGTLSATLPWITTTTTYTNRDQVLAVTEDIDASTTRTTTNGYDARGSRILITKPEGNKEAWTVNARGLVDSHTRGSGDALASTRYFAYDDNGNATTLTDGRGYVTTTVFDLFDRAYKVIDAAGHYTLRTLDDAGNVIKIQRYSVGNVEMQRTQRAFDERGRLWEVRDMHKDPATTHSDAVTTYARLKTGQLETITDALGEDTVCTYDAAGRLTEKEDAAGNTWTYTLNDAGQRTETSIEETDGTTTVTHEYESTYDALGRKTADKEIDRTNSSNVLTTAYHYDSRGNLTFVVNAEGNPTRTTCDALGRRIKRERALTLGATIDDFTAAEVTEWAFDKNGNLTTHTDDGSNSTTWTFDALDRKKVMTYPDASTVTWVCDKEDNVTSTTDAAGNVIVDTYDNLNRNSARTITLATGFAGTTSETRSFDALGRIVINSDNDYKVTLQYSVLGLKSQVYSEKQEYATGTPHAKTVTKTYDARGQKATEAYPSGLDLQYAYTAIGLLDTIGDGTNTIADYDYLGVREQKVTFQNSTTQKNGFTGFRGEVETIHHRDGSGGTLVQLDYGYNKVHDRTYERFGASGAAGDAFTYDKIRRLTKAYMGATVPSNPTTGTWTEAIDFNMDDDGNRSTHVTTPYGGSASTTTYATNVLNQYTTVGGTTPHL